MPVSEPEARATKGDDMTSAPLPDQALLHGHLATGGQGLGTAKDHAVPDELQVEDTIIDLSEDVSDPERAAVTHSPEEAFADRLDSASESDLQEQQIEVPQDDDERV